MPFGEDPIARLGDYVGAVRAAFASFASGEAPSYESPHYRVTRMQPYFNPGPDAETAVPPIYLGGVQRRACALAGRRGGRLRQPPHQLEPALPARDLPARPRRRRPVGGPRPGPGRVRDRHRHLGDHRRLARRRPGRAGAPAPPAGLLVLDAGLRPDPRALRLGRARAPPARADPPRPLGRPGRRALRRGARHAGPVRHLRRAARRAARALRRARPGHRRVAAGRHADDDAFAAVVGGAAGRAEARTAAGPAQRGMGKISSSAAMASTAARRASSSIGA